MPLRFHRLDAALADIEQFPAERLPARRIAGKNCRNRSGFSSIATCSSNAILPCIGPSPACWPRARPADRAASSAIGLSQMGQGVERRSPSAGTKKSVDRAPAGSTMQRDDARAQRRRGPPARPSWIGGDMDGKIGLEEHFAIAETLQDSAGFLAPETWGELSGRLTDLEERRLREMDAHGMETMILSLNAPAVQAIPEVARARRCGAPGQRRSGGKGRPPTGPLPRARGPALAEPGACVRRADALHPGNSVSSARWPTDSPRSRAAMTCSITTCRNTGRSGRSVPISAYPSTSIRATRCPAMPGSTTAIPG